MISQEDICVNRIYQTYDYKKFSYVKNNRELNYKHVEKIKKSIVTNDKTRVNPIIIDFKFKIIDGQHRFEACKELNKPIYYIIDAEFNNDDLMFININRKNWTTDQYLEWYIKEHNNPNYITFKNLRDFYKVSSNVVMYTLLPGDNKADRFRNGELKISNIKEKEEILKAYNVIIDAVYNPKTELINVIRFYKIHYPFIDFSELRNNLLRINKGEKIIPPSSTKHLYRLFEDAHNYNKRKKIFIDQKLVNRFYSRGIEDVIK